MSVGGRVIEIQEHSLRDLDHPTFRKEVLRLWVVDRYGTETIVYAEPQEDRPKLGENIWWSGGKIYYDHDRKSLTKVGFSRNAS